MDPTVPAKRDTEPIVLKGSAFGDWSVPANVTLKLPFQDLVPQTDATKTLTPDACAITVNPSGAGAVDPSKLQGYDPTQGGVGIPDPNPVLGGIGKYDPNNCQGATGQRYTKPEVDSAAVTGDKVAGTPTDRLLGYAWNADTKRFKQIPLQVDEVFTRYLDNSRSGFALYSGQDQHTTYAYDREGFRFTASSADDPCGARPDSVTAKDPVQGLDSNDEVAFMTEDAGVAAPADAPLPAGVDAARQVTIVDPTDQGKTRYAYVMKAAAGGPKPAYDASNGYVDYQRDANADRFAYSQSSYGDYGNAPKGPYCDPKTGRQVLNPDGTPAIGQRRPLDGATIKTKRYRYRYDGRWLMTAIQISADNGGSYGPDLVDRWKARAFAQDHSSKTPCCGYEEEDTNWGGSGITLGEKTGPVRAIRETWGADSGTNVIRRETFYKDEMRMKTWLRVHVVPPLDGIYVQWDFNAGRVKTFYNPRTADKGVKIDGKNDEEVFGNLDDPCNDDYNKNDTGQFTQGYRSALQQLSGGGYGFCDHDKNGKPEMGFPYHLSADVSDPTFSDANASLTWGMVAGPNGSIVDRTSAEATDLSPGGAAQSLLAVPYYRDDACFDDGTGSDPGPELFPRQSDKERASRAPDGSARKCWDGTGVPPGDASLRQGSIATHGLHLLFIADSDNARQTVPVDEIVGETRLVMLPGEKTGAAGEQYGRGFEKPLVPLLTPTFGAQALPSAPGGGGQPGTGGGGQTGTGGGGQSGSGGSSGAAGGGTSGGSSGSAAVSGESQPDHLAGSNAAPAPAKAKAPYPKAKPRYPACAKLAPKAKARCIARAVAEAKRKARAKAKAKRHAPAKPPARKQLTKHR